MATKYLDNTGLAYFWGKIKSYVASLLSSKADDSAVVHIAGNEAVSGLKSFSNSYSYNTYYPDRKVSAIHVVSPDITKGTTPTSTTLDYASLIFLDSNAEDSNYVNRLGAVEYTYPSANSGHNGRITLKSYKAVPAQGDSSSLSADLVVGFDSNGTSFATAPSTSSQRSEGTDILTRDWIPSDARIVHTSGAETVAGTKTFSDNATFSSAVIMEGNIRKNADNDELYVCGGSGGSNARGAYLRLKGVSASSNAGLFFLCTAKVSDSYANLNGYPNGTLTWNGQNIQTSSDERLKTPLSAVPDDVLDAWGDVQWGRFQYLDAVAQKGASARLHLGLIAQKVKAAFEARGLDACAYGILCYDVVDEIWMVRYAEAAAMEACYQRRRADRLEARIAALEAMLQ